MKNSLIIILLILTYLSSSAQQADSVVAKVYYTLKHKRDTIKPDSIYKEAMVLYLGANASLFTSYDQIIQINRIEADIAQQELNWTGPGLPLFTQTKGTRKTTNQALYIFNGLNKVYIQEYLLNNYLYEDKVEEIKWILTNETKLLNKIKVQKATSNFRGRDWTAWFSPDIPFQSGPWRLNGLPGLILEANDSKNEVQFLFEGFETKDINDNFTAFLKDMPFISLPNIAVKVKKEDINKLKQSMYKDARSFFNAQTTASRGIVDMKLLDGLSFKKINNPIDLTENN